MIYKDFYVLLVINQSVFLLDDNKIYFLKPSWHRNNLLVRLFLIYIFYTNEKRSDSQLGQYCPRPCFLKMFTSGRLHTMINTAHGLLDLSERALTHVYFSTNNIKNNFRYFF